MKILVLAPHTDDGELGCGGTIVKHLTSGDDVHYVAFSSCQESVPEGLPSDILVHEMRRATQTLGIDPKNARVLDYKVRRFNYARQEILDDLIILRREINPDVIYMPSLDDVHQDHNTIAQEALRAFKTKNIYSYELPWNNRMFRTTYFNILNEECVERKTLSIEQYASQSHRSYCNRDYIYSWAKMRGVQIGAEFAEVFDIVRQVNQ